MRDRQGKKVAVGHMLDCQDLLPIYDIGGDQAEIVRPENVTRQPGEGRHDPPAGRRGARH